MRSIILVRHGQPQHQVRGLTGGWTDMGLTDLGRKQSECVARRLKAGIENLDVRLISSDLRRACETAEIVAAELGMEFERAPELRDLNNGVAAGLTLQQAALHRIPTDRPHMDWQPFPGAETWRQFFERISLCMEHLFNEEEVVPILITHGSVILNIVAWWLGLSADDLSRVAFAAYPASISILKVDTFEEHTIERLNDTCHLFAAGFPDMQRFDIVLQR